MCGARPQLSLLDGPPTSNVNMYNDIFPILELPKSVAMNSVRQHSEPSQRPAEGTFTDSSDVDSAYEGHSNGLQASSWKHSEQQRSRPGGSHAAQTGSWISPNVSPRSACSTPGGADNSMGIQLHALVFGAHQQQRRSADPSSNNRRLQQSLPDSSGRHRSGPYRNQSSTDLRRGGSDASALWGGSSYSRGGYVLQSLTALGMNGSPRKGGCSGRGSISKAKQVLAEAINCIPGAHGFGHFPLSTCDTGVLSPLLSIIRQNGAVSSRSSFSDSSSSCSGGSAACGFSCGSSGRCLHSGSCSLVGTSRCCNGRLPRQSSSGDGECCSSTGIPPTLPEEGPPELDYQQSVDEFMKQKQRHQAAQLQKVVDCIDTVKYLAMDDSNRMALIDLGVVELLLSKLQPAAKPAQDVTLSCLAALAAICKHDVMKQQLWDNPDSAVILQLLSSKHNTPEVKAAHQAIAQLGWSVDNISGNCCTSHATGSIFDSVTSHISSADSSSSTCSGANVLLEPAIVPALAAALHPAADVPVLMSALKLLSKAAASDEYEHPATPGTPSSGSTNKQQQPTLMRQQQVSWNKVLFALMPLLIPTQRRQGHLVLNAALELLVVLTERHPELHASVCAAGCLPPLLVQVLEGLGQQSLQAACILTGIVDSTAAQERLAQAPALGLLLRVLQDKGRSVDVRLAAVHVLRRLATCVPKVAQMLRYQGATPVVVTLVKEVPDHDVRRAAAGLLQLLGTPVVFRPRQGRSLDYGSRAFSNQQGLPQPPQQRQRVQQHRQYQSYMQQQQQQQMGIVNAVAAGCCISRSLLYA